MWVSYLGTPMNAETQKLPNPEILIHSLLIDDDDYLTECFVALLSMYTSICLRASVPDDFSIRGVEGELRLEVWFPRDTIALFSRYRYPLYQTILELTSCSLNQKRCASIFYSILSQV